MAGLFLILDEFTIYKYFVCYNERKKEKNKMKECDVECCENCKHMVEFPKNNSYNDIDYFCLVNGYFLHGIKKDRTTIKRYSPGGKALECRYERKQ